MVTEKEHLVCVSEGNNKLEIWKGEMGGYYEGAVTFDVSNLKKFEQWRAALLEKGIKVSNDAHRVLTESLDENDFNWDFGNNTFVAEFTLYLGTEHCTIPMTLLEMSDFGDLQSEFSQGHAILALVLRLLLTDAQITERLETTMLLIMQGFPCSGQQTLFLNPNALELGKNLGAYVTGNEDTVFPKDALYVFGKKFNED